MFRTTFQALAASCCLFYCTTVNAMTTVFFDSTQVATDIASGVTADTISSNGYLFTYTRDKLFTGGTGTVIGRPVRVPWPEGVEAQAVTTPPAGVTDYKARIILQRVDGDLFDLTAFTARLLANTAATGAAIEIMPMLHGEDGFNDPLYFDASGYYGSTFSYDTSPNYLGSTALLTGFDAYDITLFVDYALTALTLEGASVCDFDANAVCDVGDLNALLAEGPLVAGVTVTPGVNEQFDITGNGVIDNADVSEWLTIAADQNGLASPYKRGDANLDGIVDGQDFILWNGSKFTSTLLWDHGDFNGDGVVDGQDFILWNGTKFSSSDAVSGVPEPSMSILLGVALLLSGKARADACMAYMTGRH